MAKLRQYSAETDREIHILLERERQQKAFDIGQRILVDDPGTRIVRWCRTTTNASFPTYPTSGNRFVIEFGNLTFDNTDVGAITEVFVAYTPQVTRIAFSPDGLVPQSTVVRATMHHGKWYLDSSVGDCDTIRFIIVSSDPATRTALVLIQSRPVGCADVPESTLSGTVVEVCDPQGCFLNEPNVDLTGRHGWAKYMLPVATNICQPDIRYLTAQWEVTNLCCGLADCTA